MQYTNVELRLKKRKIDHVIVCFKLQFSLYKYVRYVNSEKRNYTHH